MDMRISTSKLGPLPPEYVTDPDEKEISDDDDDRNHKHRRRDARSQSLEKDASQQVLSRPYRKMNKPFENGYLYRGTGSQSSEVHKNQNFDPLDKDISVKFERKRAGFTPISRAPLDVNLRNKGNIAISTDPVAVRGRGREFGSWTQHDSRFTSFDIASKIVQQGSISSSPFAGRGLPTVSNARVPSWGAFGLVPGISNGGLDTLHSFGLQGALRPAISPPLSMGVPRQRCRDFDERGFCLRGDMCPMEHGVNRIVVEDVQSLSQFNLPVSLPGPHFPGPLAGTASLPTTFAPSSALLNNKSLHARSIKGGGGDNVMATNGALIDSTSEGGADVYDPDQPLWGNGSSESAALQGLNPSGVEDNDSLFDAGPSGDPPSGFTDIRDDERMVKGGSKNSSVWGRIGSSKNRTEMQEKMVSKIASNFIKSETKENERASISAQVSNEGISESATDLSTKSQDKSGRGIRKPSQKAQCTLFINGIPQQSNKRESLLSHFQKFGKVVDVYIPLNSERAFVQFFKREEAEAALTAPDAVMGNRFIKLWWANRDNIPHAGAISGTSVPMTHRGVGVASSPRNIAVANKGDDPPKGSNASPSAVRMTASDHPQPVVVPPVSYSSDQTKHVIANGPKAPPPLQRKLESLEVLKEELRKKQEMLDKKRNDFRLQLDLLEKQSTGLKWEVALEQVAKKQKVEELVEGAKVATPGSSDTAYTAASPKTEVMADSIKAADSVGTLVLKSDAKVALQEHTILKPSIRPLAPVGGPFMINRFKLDNRPTAFKIIPPLPDALANVAALKEHFSAFGNLSSVELDDSELADGVEDSETSKVSAHIGFTRRHSAEKAFLGGKIWKGQDLQFVWLKPSISNKDIFVAENPVPSPKGSSDVHAPPPPVGKIASNPYLEAAKSGRGSEKLERRDDEQKKQDVSTQSS